MKGCVGTFDQCIPTMLDGEERAGFLSGCGLNSTHNPEYDQELRNEQWMRDGEMQRLPSLAGLRLAADEKAQPHRPRKAPWWRPTAPMAAACFARRMRAAT